MVTTASRPQAPAERLPAQSRRIIGTLLVAAFVVILNETIMGVALPRLMADLSVDARTGQWLTTAFMLTMAIVIPTTGFLLQRLSTRTVFGLAMGLFSAGTLLAAISPGFWLLLLARIVQASGTAMMIPLLMTTVLTLVPVERRGVVMGNISIAISVAPAIGPTISGLVLQFLSWRFMFVLVLPIALAALAYGLRTLTDVGEAGHQKLDPLSVVLSVPAFGGIVYGLSQLGQESAAGSSVGHRQSGCRRGLPAGLRRTPASPRPRRRQPAAGPATVRVPDVQPESGPALRRDAVPVRHDHPAADLPADRPRHRVAADRPDAAARRAADGPARVRRSARSSTATARRR